MNISKDVHSPINIFQAYRINNLYKTKEEFNNSHTCNYNVKQNCKTKILFLLLISQSLYNYKLDKVTSNNQNVHCIALRELKT